MKISVEKARKSNLISEIHEIRLNGLKITGCIFADEENGVVQVFLKDEFYPGMETVPSKLIHGNVEILMGDRK